MLSRIKKIAFAHKIISGIIAVLVLSGSYYEYKRITDTSQEVRYVLGTAEKSTLISSVSGSGQVSVSNQVDVKAKVSGDVIYVGVKNGDAVGAGTLFIQLDARDAEKSVRDAETNLESTKLSLQKLKQPADQLSILQAENALAQAKESKQKAQDDLKKSYEDGFNEVSGSFIDLPGVMTGLQDMLFGTTITGSGGQTNIAYYGDIVKSYDAKSLVDKDDTDRAYQKARQKYDNNFRDYKSVSRFDDAERIASIVNETHATAKDIAEAVKNAQNLIQFYEDKLTERSMKPIALADTHLASLNTSTGKVNGHLVSLLSIVRTIELDKEAITNTDRTIAEKTESLVKLKAGADGLDIQSQKLAVRQKENALQDAKEKLADYFIRAPFAGTIAKIAVKKGDQVSVSTVAATLITTQRIAEISLNEIDVAKIKVREKATLTFDAVPDLKISGEVSELDAVGTVSQGVVSYIVKINFDTQDARVKPGMSVSAAIITDVKQEVLAVPISAVKSQGGSSYVEVPVVRAQGNSTATGVTLATLPRRVPVETGVSNDELIEIISGLKEGDEVVITTLNPQTKTSAAQQSSGGLRLPGLPGGGGGRGAAAGGGR